MNFKYIGIIFLITLFITYIYINSIHIKDVKHPRYILYYSNGGIIHNLRMLHSMVVLAKKYNRILIIYNDYNFNDFFYFQVNSIQYPLSLILENSKVSNSTLFASAE